MPLVCDTYLPCPRRYRVKLSVIDPGATPDAEDDEHTQGSAPALQFAHPIALTPQEPPKKGDGDVCRPWMAPEGVAPGQRKHGFEEKAPARSYTAEEVGVLPEVAVEVACRALEAPAPK